MSSLIGRRRPTFHFRTCISFDACRPSQSLSAYVHCLPLMDHGWENGFRKIALVGGLPGRWAPLKSFGDTIRFTLSHTRAPPASDDSDLGNGCIGSSYQDCSRRDRRKETEWRRFHGAGGSRPTTRTHTYVDGTTVSSQHHCLEGGRLERSSISRAS